MLASLKDKGTAVVRARFASRRMQPPNISPLGDFTTAGGFTALTGQELWLVSSVFPFLVAPIFDGPSSLVSNCAAGFERARHASRAFSLFARDKEGKAKSTPS